MGSLLASLAALSALLPVVAARRGGGGSSIGGDSSDFFDAPPLEIANLAAYSILAFVTLIQLAMALPHLFRSGWTRIPAAGVVVALLIMAVGYALGAGTIVALYRRHSFFGNRIVSVESLIDLEAAGSIFFKLADPAMFLAVAFVLLNRYRAAQKKLSIVAIGFTSAAFVLVMLMIALVVAKDAIASATFKAQFRDTISFTETADRITTSNNCFYAFVAFHVVSIIFLAVSAFLVRTRTKNDKIMSLTLFAIVPLLLIHALARLIFAIVGARLSETGSLNIDISDAIDFTTTLIYGLLYVAAMSILVFLLARPQLWNAERLPTQGATPSNYAAQGIPPAQFPGQWGYPQQPQGFYPQQPQGPYPQQPPGPYPLQYAYVPIFPAQNPTVFGTPAQPPQSEKVQSSPQPSPPPAHS